MSKSWPKEKGKRKFISGVEFFAIYFVLDPLDPGAGPKCFKASRLRGPRSKMVFVPVGALRAN